MCQVRYFGEGGGDCAVREEKERGVGDEDEEERIVKEAGNERVLGWSCRGAVEAVRMMRVGVFMLALFWTERSWYA